MRYMISSPPTLMLSTAAGGNLIAPSSRLPDLWAPPPPTMLCAMASYIPARRAARVDPLIALSLVKRLLMVL
jgi:hypothetical protein